MDGPEKGWDFVCGLDLGTSRDASAVVVLAVRRVKQAHGRIRLAHLQLWKPSKGKRVDLQEIEDTLQVLHDRFNFKQIPYDPWQATHLASRLQAVGLGRLVKGSNRPVGLPMVEIPQIGANLQRIATVMRKAFSDRGLDLYKDPDLERYIRRLRNVEGSYGFRLESPKDSTGHDDAGSTFQYAMVVTSQLAAIRKIKLHVGVDSYPDADDPLAAVQQRMADWDRRQADYDAEQRWLAEPSDPMAGIAAALREKLTH